MDVNVAKSNAMASYPVSGADASILSAFMSKTLETVPLNKSNAHPNSVRLDIN